MGERAFLEFDQEVLDFAFLPVDNFQEDFDDGRSLQRDLVVVLLADGSITFNTLQSGHELLRFKQDLSILDQDDFFVDL